MSLLAAYLGWAAVGKLVTGYSPYFFLDAEVVGSRLRIALNSAGFVALGPLGMQSSPYPARHGEEKVLTARKCPSLCSLVWPHWPA